jgi:hypothetical protein
MGVAPSGRELTYMPMAIHHIMGGKIAEQWSGGTGLSELRRQRLEQEISERASAREVGGDFYDFHPLSAGKVGARGGGCHRQGSASSAGDVHHLRHVAPRSPEPYLASRDAPGSQRGALSQHPPNMFVTCFYGVLDPRSG